MDLLVGDDVIRASAIGKVALQRARRDGATQRVWRGVDLTAHAALGADGRLRATAALHAGAVLSGPSALRLYRFDVPDDWPEEITLPVAVRGRPGLTVRSGHLSPAEQLVHRGLAATTPLRSVADALRLRPPPEALWVLDQALRRDMGATDIGRMLGVGGRGVRTARSLLTLGDAARESALESRVRWVLHQHGVPAPVCQHPEPRARARLDFAWPAARVALESDGARWHDAPAALHRDRSRQNALAALGWLVLRCTWPDAVERAGELASFICEVLASRSTFASRHAAGV